MVLFDRAMMELSSLVASVTLRSFVSLGFISKVQFRHLHQGVGLLLLLEDGCRGVQLLERIVSQLYIAT